MCVTLGWLVGCLWLPCVGLLLDCGFDANAGLFVGCGCVVQWLIGWWVLLVWTDWLPVIVGIVNCFCCLVVALYLVIWFGCLGRLCCAWLLLLLLRVFVLLCASWFVIVTLRLFCGRLCSGASIVDFNIG